MSDSEHNDDDIQSQLLELEQRIDSLNEQCLYKTSVRVANEMKRVAKGSQQLIPYLRAGFHVMNHAGSLMQPEVVRDSAVELIAYLESEDRARQFQADLPDDEYERTKWWLTACSYDNLATSTARMQGFNSDGMHQCVHDGIQVCRRTGKLQCITCFREYATDVYAAADDLDMALHYARVGLNREDPGPHDRRYVGAKDICRLLMLQGDLHGAIEMLGRAWTLCDGYHSEYQARLKLTVFATELFHLLGQPERLSEFPKHFLHGDADAQSEFSAAVEPSSASKTSADGQPKQPIWKSEHILIAPPADEYPDHYLEWDGTLALVDCCEGRFDEALRRLTPWDKTLRERRCLNDWFDLRLRLIAVHRLSGKQQQVQALAKPLKEQATLARDFLTLRRLERLLDDSIPATPLALVGDLTEGPFARKRILKSAALPATGSSATGSPDPNSSPQETASPSEQDHAEEQQASQAESSDEDDGPETPYGPTVVQLYEVLMKSSGEPEKLLPGVMQLLDIDPTTVTDPADAGQLLHVARFLTAEESLVEPVLKWGEAVLGLHAQNPTVISMFAALASRLRDVLDHAAFHRAESDNATESPAADPDVVIPRSRIENLFRQSLDLDPHSFENHARAGTYHLEQENYPEAERCLARGFRLQRSSGYLALRLSEVYSRTERSRDALAVLDMALREGCDDPDVAWDAAMTASNLEQFAAALTYLEHFDKQRPDEPWTHYYRAAALLELGRPQEALEAIALEEIANPELTYHSKVVRVSALGALRQESLFRAGLLELCVTPLRTVTYLTTNGLLRLFTRLWKSCDSLPSNDGLRRQWEDFLLASGFAPNELFEAARTALIQPAATSDSQGNDEEGSPSSSADVADGGSSSPTEMVHFYHVVLHQPLDERWPTSIGCLADEENWTAYHIHWGVLARDEEQAETLALAWQRRCHSLAPTVLEVILSGSDYRDHPGVVWQGMREGQAAESD